MNQKLGAVERSTQTVRPKNEIRVAYDTSYLATFFDRTDCKTGIFRVTEEVLYELTKIKGLEVTALALCGRFGTEEDPFRDAVRTFLYLENRKGALECKFYPALKNRFGLSKSYWEAINSPLPKGFRMSPLRSIHIRGLRSILYRLDHTYKMERITRTFNPRKFDVFHSPFSKLPSEGLTRGTPRVLTIYDLIPVVNPKFVDARFQVLFREILDSINRQRDWVACISEHTKQEFCEHTGMSPDRVFVTPLAAASHFYPVSDAGTIDAVRRRYGIPEGRYFLTIATPQPRKNLIRFIRAFYDMLSEMPTTDVSLVLVGSSQQSSIQDEMLSAIKSGAELSSRVVFTDYIPDEDLSAVYSGATAFVFPSLYEGFGLPALEAMQCGTPVIASNTTSIPEVVGDAGILIDPTDSDQLCQAMLDVLSDESLRDKLRRDGLAKAKEFSWEKCAAKVVEIYKKAVSC